MDDRSNARHVTERWRVSVTHYVQNILVFEGFMKRRRAREMKYNYIDKGKAVPLHAMEALGGRGDIAPTHSRPRH
jgi:hypothetical protein